LTKVLKSTSDSEEIQAAKWDAMIAIQKLPANSSKIRVHNRCGLTGRPRGYMRQFGISRVTFREMALSGKIPGVKKASW
jgi:small subunit ribosomal protein S14